MNPLVKAAIATIPDTAWTTIKYTNAILDETRPEFADKGKGSVTVWQLVSHQVGLPQATPALSWAEILDHHAAAARLAESRPIWHPGSAFGYHAITIGNLSSELVFRLTGRTLEEYYEEEIRGPSASTSISDSPPQRTRVGFPCFRSSDRPTTQSMLGRPR